MRRYYNYTLLLMLFYILVAGLTWLILTIAGVTGPPLLLSFGTPVPALLLCVAADYCFHPDGEWAEIERERARDRARLRDSERRLSEHHA